jgi:two-component system, cell cycle sensor histidine kinase and response regulator CckA
MSSKSEENEQRISARETKERQGSLNREAPEESSVRSQDIPRGSGERILVVDDEKFQLELIKDLLGRFSYVAIPAESGEEALEVLEREKGEVDLVILDLSMPGMGGSRCLQEMLRIKPDLKVIIASGYSACKKVRETLNSGAAGFIAKPYHYHEMILKIRQSLHAKKQI